MHLRKVMYSAASEWNVLYIFVKFVCYNVWINYSVSLLIFSLKDLVIADSEVLKSLTIIVTLSISPLRSVSICLIYFGAQVMKACTFFIVYLIDVVTPLYNNTILCLLLTFFIEVYFIWYMYVYAHFLFTCLLEMSSTLWLLDFVCLLTEMSLL